MQQTLNTSPEMQAFTKLAGRNGDVRFQRRMPGHISRIASAAQEAKAAVSEPLISASFVRKVLIVIFSVFAVSILLFAVANFYGDSISRGGHTASSEKLEVIIGNDVLNIPANYIRYSNQRRPGIHQRLELYIHWPSLSGYRDELQNAFNVSSQESNLVFATLEKRSMAYDMSGRISPIYKRFFVGSPQEYRAGLVKQQLSSEGGFIDEDLYYAAGSPYPFATRCVRENSNIGTPYCLRDIHITENLSLTYRFHKRLLDNWISIDKKMRETLKSMLIQPVKG